MIWLVITHEPWKLTGYSKRIDSVVRTMGGGGGDDHDETFMKVRDAKRYL